MVNRIPLSHVKKQLSFTKEVDQNQAMFTVSKTAVWSYRITGFG